jgi:epoxide hydrolase 4
MAELKDGFVEVDRDVRLHYVEAGEGPLVVLLHGFPEFWYSWRLQLTALAAAGFRTVAVDQRGYNLSSKPDGLEAYRVRTLARDIERLIIGLGAERASLVGHDWGGGVAWRFAWRYPERLVRLAILNAPHPERFLRGLRTLRQLRKSWYMFFFQLPRLPEALLRANNFAAIRRELPTSADASRYIEALNQPGALTATLNWYRAMFRAGVPSASSVQQPIEAPVLVIWGERDRYLGVDLAQPDPRLVPYARVERLPDATHWVQVDQPEAVNSLLIEFLKGS